MGCWGADFGGMLGKLNLSAIAIAMYIKDHAGIAVTYDRRIRREIKKDATDAFDARGLPVFSH